MVCSGILDNEMIHHFGGGANKQFDCLGPIMHIALEIMTNWCDDDNHNGGGDRRALKRGKWKIARRTESNWIAWSVCRLRNSASYDFFFFFVLFGRSSMTRRLRKESNCHCVQPHISIVATAAVENYSATIVSQLSDRETGKIATRKIVNNFDCGMPMRLSYRYF